MNTNKKSYKSILDKLLIKEYNPFYYDFSDETDHWNNILNELDSLYDNTKKWNNIPTLRKNIPLIISLLKEMEPEIVSIYNKQLEEYSKDDE